MTTETRLQPASTVILLRPAEPKGFEVFLTRRPQSMAFLGGMYVFPGGSVRKEDCMPAILQRCHGLPATEARKILGAALKPQVALGHWVAAVRELYEEAGILLAVTEGGKSLTGAAATRLQRKRKELTAGSLNFDELLKDEGLLCDLRRVLYFSRWQAPRGISTRFDTRFYLAPLPGGQIASPDRAEVVECLWLTPDQALRRVGREELPMIFPTFASLRTLADFESMESVFHEFGAKKQKSLS